MRTLYIILSLLLTTAIHADNTVGGDDMPWDNDDPVVTGDVNADGVVNILDITALIKLLHEQQQTGKPTTNAAADVNNDGKVTVDDVTALRQIICINTETQSRRGYKLQYTESEKTKTLCLCVSVFK